MLGVWQGTVVDAAGDVRPDATVEFKRESDGAFATLWQDIAGTIPALNPVDVDANGFVRVYLQGNETYRIKAVDGVFELNWRDVLIPVPLNAETLEVALTPEILSAVLTAEMLGDVMNPLTTKEGDAGLDAGDINTLFASEYIRVKRYAPAGTAFTGADADRAAHTLAARNALLVANEHDGARVVFEHGGFVLNGPLVPDANDLELIADGADIYGGSDFPENGFLIHSLSAGGGDTTANQAILDAIYGTNVVLVRSNRPSSLEGNFYHGLRLHQGFAPDPIGGISITGFTRACLAQKIELLDFEHYGMVMNGSWSCRLDAIRARGNGADGTGFGFGVIGFGVRGGSTVVNAFHATGLHAGSHNDGIVADFGVRVSIEGTVEGNGNDGFRTQSLKSFDLKLYCENNVGDNISLGGSNGVDYADFGVIQASHLHALAGRRNIRMRSVRNCVIGPFSNAFDEADNPAYQAESYFMEAGSGPRVYGNHLWVREANSTYIGNFGTEFDLDTNIVHRYGGTGAPYVSFARMAARGEFRHFGSTLGLYSAAAVSKQTVTGSRGGNAALADLLSELAEVGAITDSSSA
jgi:hypothetical protein